MELKDYLPIWHKLSQTEKDVLNDNAVLRHADEGMLLHSESLNCEGLYILCSGQLRACITSGEGREITLYRLFAYDLCLFSASCMLHNIQFDISIEAEKSTDYFVISPEIYNDLMSSSLVISKYTNDIISTHLSDVIWLMEQIMWQKFDKRLAEFLLEESRLEGNATIKTTHEKIALHLGTAREVVTRMLKYFQNEGMVSLTRGSVTLTDPEKLASLDK